MSNYFWCGKCGGTFDPSLTYCPNCDGVVVTEQQARIIELETETDRLKKRIEIISKAATDSQTLRNMLRAMQAGELTVSRGVELVDFWLAGNYSDDMLPPVRHGLGEDEMPWDRIDSLAQQRDALAIALAELRERVQDDMDRLYIDGVLAGAKP